jgi:CheY-like chemotaxis protein
MSHEIRTPLNGIIGMVNILQAENPKHEQKEYLESLQFASKNMLCLVNDILDHNKIASGKLTLEEVPFHLHRLVQDIKRSHLPKAVEKGIALSVVLEPGVPELVKADPTRLTQVLNNLVGNAVKFTLKGGVTVTAKPVGNREDAVAVRFEVRDTGIGFDKTEAGKLFCDYSQANDSISRQFGGTGLGLVISQKLAKLMGSGITATSTLGIGSCFSFEVWLKNSQPAPEEEAKESTTGPSKMSVLIADDNALNILVTRKMLQQQNMEVDVAYNGREAVEKVQSAMYDLVLMDAQMPVMDGLAAIRQFRKEKLYSGPVILLTADAFINNSNEVHSWGFDDYLLKPFSAEDLYRKISAVTLRNESVYAGS